MDHNIYDVMDELVDHNMYDAMDDFMDYFDLIINFTMQGT